MDWNNIFHFSLSWSTSNLHTRIQRFVKFVKNVSSTSSSRIWKCICNGCQDRHASSLTHHYLLVQGSPTSLCVSCWSRTERFHMKRFFTVGRGKGNQSIHLSRSTANLTLAFVGCVCFRFMCEFSADSSWKLQRQVGKAHPSSELGSFLCIWIWCEIWKGFVQQMTLLANKWWDHLVCTGACKKYNFQTRHQGWNKSRKWLGTFDIHDIIDIKNILLLLSCPSNLSIYDHLKSHWKLDKKPRLPLVSFWWAGLLL